MLIYLASVLLLCGEIVTHAVSVLPGVDLPLEIRVEAEAEQVWIHVSADESIASLWPNVVLPQS